MAWLWILVGWYAIGGATLVSLTARAHSREHWPWWIYPFAFFCWWPIVLIVLAKQVKQ